MSAGWIAQGADAPAPADGAPADPWTPKGADTPSVPALVRGHQDLNAHPVDNTRGLFTRAKDVLLGHEPQNAQDPDQAHQAGILPAIGAGAQEAYNRFTNADTGPSVGKLAQAYPKLLKADVSMVGAGYQETVGSKQVQDAQRTLAGLTVLPQIADLVDKSQAGQGAGTRGGVNVGELQKTDQMAQNPLVAKKARELGISPQDFAADWKKYSGLPPEEQAAMAARAKDLLQRGQDKVTSGTATRNQAWADRIAYQPTDLVNGPLDPWSAKGIAFNTALALPEMAAVTGVTVGASAVGGPGAGLAAGGAAAAAMFAPAQREEAKIKIENQVQAKLEQADAIDQNAPVGQKRGLNPESAQLRQQAADLAASSDRIANTAGFLYAVGDAAGMTPLGAVLTKAPGSQAVLNRIVGAGMAKTVGGRIAGAAVANGAGGVLQTALQQAVDVGIVHEDMTLKDALAAMAYSGVTAAVTGGVLSGAHEAAQAPERARQQREQDLNDLSARVQGANAGLADRAAGFEPGQTYAGYRWDDSAPNGRGGFGRYVPTDGRVAPRYALPGPGGGETPAAPTGEPSPSPAEAPGAAGRRQAYEAKTNALNAAAAAAEKRSDVTLEPEEEGWSVHVKGQPVATFDTVEAAREAMAQARKLVGTKPAQAETTSAPGATEAPERATEAPETETPAESVPKPAQVRPAVIPMGQEREPETELERTQPVQSERRRGGSLRERFDQMTPDQRFAALYSHDVTGIPNKRAYDDSEKKATQVSVDADSLKWFNTQGSHEGGDQLLKAIAQAGHEQSPGNFYHKGGDEFVLQADSPAEAEAHMEAIKGRLAQATIEMTAPDGRKLTVKGIGVTHGTGSTFEEADRAMERNKEARTKAGLRAGRDQQPPGATFAAPEAGVQGDQGHAATESLPGSGSAGKETHAEVLGETLEKPAVPTPKQARAGNYFKPTTAWNGIPIKVENVKGQKRPYLDAVTGKPGERTMKADYGYVMRTQGADGDAVDIMMGPHHQSQKAFVIDQLTGDGKRFDEHKIQIGVRSEAEARKQYLSHYPKDWKGLGGIRQMTPEQLKQWLEFGDTKAPLEWKPKVEHLLEDPDIRGRFEQMAHEAGWAEEGGRMIRHEVNGGRGNESKISRTQWLPHHPWFAEQAERLGKSDRSYEAVVKDALEGKKLNAKERRVVDGMVRTAQRQVEEAKSRVPATTPEEAADWRKPVPESVLNAMTDEQMDARLTALEAEEERLAKQEADRPVEAEAEDDIPFQRPPGKKAPLQQQDLFGAQDHIRNEIKKLEAAKDRKRNSGQESVETGRSDDLFSQARQQTDLTDVAKPTPPESVKPTVNRERPTTLYRGTETGTGGVKRESSGGEIGRAIYATPHRWLAESYGGGPKARPGAGRDVHELTLPLLPPEQYGYIEGGSIRGEKARLVDHTGKVLHEYEGALMSGAAERDAIRGIAEKAGIKVIVGEKDSIAENQVAILDPALIAHRTVTATPTGNLSDAGEKIGGARKDRWAERGLRLSDLSDMTETEAAGLVNKKAVWNPDWAKLIAGGMEPKTAAVAKLLFDQLAARPRYNTPDGRRHYVETLGRVRDMLLEAKSLTDVKGIQGKLIAELGMPTGYSIASTPEQKLARDKFWSIQKGRRSTLGVHYSDERKADELLAKGWPTKPVKEKAEGEPSKEKQEAKEPKRPHLDRINRIGPPVRTGDVTSSDFIRDFGMRGLEFGNWAANDERQRLLNHAYEGLNDLARILNVPPQALSLNGTMGLALGARGGGRFAAHYEPGKLVINMTKINGAGALAHEWGHALDHYMGELGRADAYTTNARGASGWYSDRRNLSNLRPELQEAWNGIMEAMYHRHVGAAEFLRDAELQLERQQSALDKSTDPKDERYRQAIRNNIARLTSEIARARAEPDGTFGSRTSNYQAHAGMLGEYWRRPTEMFARAFESYVFDKIKAEGNQSDYLVHGTLEPFEKNGRKLFPWPEGEDRTRINGAIQKLVDQLKVEGEKFAIREGNTSNGYPTEDVSTDSTHYELREPKSSRAKAKNLRSAAAVRQLDIFADASNPAPAAEAARLAQTAKLVPVGEFRSGIDRVTKWQDAAHILAPLRKYPQENMTALVLNSEGKPLVVIRHSIGAADSAHVEPWSLAGAIMQVPGAAQVYFAHQHPSGVVSQSNADHAITTRLHNILNGSGVKPMGMIVVAPNSKSASYFEPDPNAGENSYAWGPEVVGTVTPARRRGMVPFSERRLAKQNQNIGPLTGRELKAPALALQAVRDSGLESGVLLVNHRNKIVGVVPMSPAEMRKLRTGDLASGAGRLLDALAAANSTGIIAFGKAVGVRNVASFGNAVGVRTLDAITVGVKDPHSTAVSPTLTSAAEKGEMPTGSAFLQRGAGDQGGRLTPEAIQGHSDQILSGFAVKPPLVIHPDLNSAREYPGMARYLEGAAPGDVIAFVHDGKIHLIADQIADRGQLASTLAHEYITHFGLRAAFGTRRLKAYQDILDGVAQAMPAEVRIRGEQEFPGRYNPLNAHMRNVAAEEALAYYGQRYSAGQDIPSRMRRFLDRLHALIRDWLREVLGLPKKFDELFVKRTLADLEAFLRRGRTAQASAAEAGPAFAGNEDTFFSGLARAVDAAKREKGTGAEWEATLKNMSGVKAEELEWTGLKDWLAGRGRVSKAEVAEYVAAHRVQLGEVLRGGGQQQRLTDEHLATINQRLQEEGYDALEPGQRAMLREGGGAASSVLEELSGRIGMDVSDIPYADNGGALQPKFDEYVAPGGQNYRELLLTLPPPKPSAELLAGRKAVFDRYQPRLDEIDRQTDAYQYGGQRASPIDLGPLNRERNRLMAERDAAANAVGWIDPAERVTAARAAVDRTRTDSLLASRHLIEAWQPSQIEAANIYHWLSEASSPTDEMGLRDGARSALEALVEKNTGGTFPDGGRALLDDALAAARASDAAQAELQAALKVHSAGSLFTNSHWDEPNVLAHVRFDDRTGPQGEKVLHLAEVQSDWHQKGRRQGYKGVGSKEVSELEITQARTAALQTLRRNDNLGFDSAAQALHAVMAHDDWINRWGDMPEVDRQELDRYRNMRLQFEAQGAQNKVPDAPFKTTWPELAMKRMLRYAAEHGYDALSWDTGATNADRYNLRRRVERIAYASDVGHLQAFDDMDNQLTSETGIKPEKLPDYIGKEAADRLLATERDAQGYHNLKGSQLEIGGEGMRAFYDKMLPATVGKLVKKWGGKVERVERIRFPPADALTRNERDELDVLESLGAHNHTVAQAARMGQLQGRATHVMPGREEGLPAHMVRITPAMRDSVMQGQPMFLKRRKGSSGTAPAPAPKRSAYDRAASAIAAIPKSEFMLSFRRIADPGGVSEPAEATALVTREALGELAHSSEEALQNLERWSKAFDLLGTQDRYDFIDAMETGSKQPRAELQPAADAIRELLDDWRERIRGLGTGALDNFIENYFPHIWNNDAKAKKVFGQIFGKRPLKGPASFLKERTIPTTKEGLEKGLTPISTNPLVLAFAKLREMQRFYTGVKLMQRFKDEGLAKFLPGLKMAPEGWAQIEDAVGRVLQWSEAEGGFVIRGSYIMPADAARVINNHLSASALRNFMPAQLFRTLSNAVNALQLGFSAFHLGFTTLDAVISKNALGIERLIHGEPLRAAQAFLEASTFFGGAGMNLMRGHRLLKAYANMSRATPEMQKIVAGLIAAGGRVKMDNYYQAARGLSPFKGVGFATLASEVKAALTQPTGKLAAAAKVMGGFPREYATRLMRDLQEIWELEPLKVLPLMSALEVAGRATRASTSIIMEHIVPLQKLGVFSDLAADHIRRNPDQDPVAFAQAMQRIWDSVDNRLGEMVYNNLFWHATFKEVNHMAVRAVGWNLGTIRELGGAPVDVVKLLDYLAKGAPAEGEFPSLTKTAQARADYEAQKAKFTRIAEKVGHKIAYTVALLGTTMIVGAIMQYLLTGSGPEETKDYFFPRTGRKTKYGTWERISLPSYVKDLYEYGTQPGTTLINKANPIFGMLHAIWANEDFFGNAVRDPDAGVMRQIIESAQYAMHETIPFAVQGGKQFAGAGKMDAKGSFLTAAPYVGLAPAPARVTSPEQMERYQLRETEKSYIRGLQYKLKQAQAKNDVPEVNRLRDEIRQHKLAEKATEGKIKEDKEKAAEAADKISSLIHGQSREGAAQALEQAGMPAFAALWRSLPEQPRDRVAHSLEAFV